MPRNLRTYRVTLTITQDDNEFIPLGEWDWAEVLDPGCNAGFIHRLERVEAVPLDDEQAQAIDDFDNE